MPSVFSNRADTRSPVLQSQGLTTRHSEVVENQAALEGRCLYIILEGGLQDAAAGDEGSG